MFERFTDRARRVVVLAQEETRRLNHDHIGTEHLLIALIREQEGVAATALRALGGGLEWARELAEEINQGRGQQAPRGHIPFTPRAKKALELSLREALALGHNYIGTEHLLLGLIREGEGPAIQVLARMGVEPSQVRQQVIRLLHGYQSGPAKPAVPFRNLTEAALAGSLDPVVGRQHEIERVMQALMLPSANNPVLVGEHGAGVTAVAHGFVQAASAADAPAGIAGKQIWEFDLPGLLRLDSISRSGQFYGTASDSRLAQMVRSLRDGIAFVENSCVPVRASSRTVRAITLLRPMLAAGDVRAIVAMTPAEYREFIDADDGLSGVCRPVPVEELPEELAVQALIANRERYESRHGVAIMDAAIIAAVTLSAQHIPGAPLPGKAVSLLDGAAALVARRNADTERFRELEQRLADLRSRKDAAIDRQDFERAVALRDQEKQAETELAGYRREWENIPTRRIVAVTEQDVLAALPAASRAVAPSEGRI